MFFNDLKAMANRTETENGGATLYTSGSTVLDLFGTIGGLRSASEADIIMRFERAWAENPTMALRTIFYGRDIRGGLGERRVFRIALKYLADVHPNSVINNLDLIAEYGRWDDILVLLRTKCNEQAVKVLRDRFVLDWRAYMTGNDSDISLLAKWLPSINASNKQTVTDGKYLAAKFHYTERQYRQKLTALRAKIRIIENNLREKDYTFDYSKQPSKAMFKYRKAFIRNDEQRYRTFMEDVASGKETVHAGTLYPYDIVRTILDNRKSYWSPYWGTGEDKYVLDISETERLSLNTTWDALPDYSNGMNAICVIDGSGSMYGRSKGVVEPASVALSLGIYFAEHTKGEFANHFITFSHNPRLVEVKGQDIAEKVIYCAGYNEVADTDIEKVFDLVLNTAIMHRTPRNEMPETIFIISDMEFNMGTTHSNLTAFESAKAKYRSAGYNLPQIVFWNVDSRNEQQPVSMNEQGAVLVSGCTPKIFEMVASGNYSPMDFMLEVLHGERYNKINA